MHRRIDEPQRRLNPSEPFPSRVVPPSGAPRYSDAGEGALSANMSFPIPGYQLSQPTSHHGPVPGSLSGLGVQAGNPSQALHASINPGHQPNLPSNQAISGPGLTGGQQQQQQQQQQFQRLKVEDALSYLDQVKLQFGNQPQVYNDFLDIMKEFKSQTIDTPGVINRVSNLFQGHPDLIVGFNTFLPPGYKIEVQRETINVHQPGKQVMSIAALAQSQVQAQVNKTRPNKGMSIWDVALASQATSVKKKLRFSPQQPNKPVHPPALTNTSTASPADHRSYHQSPRPAPDSTTPAAPLSQQQAPNSQQQQQSQQQQNQQSQQQQQQQQQGGQPVEFNHAINYVNKIKNRFQGQPDIYKQFLEILHTYQKEQRLTRDFPQGISVGPAKPLTESEVYQQVANLFKHQEDLLAEFGQFLPDANGASAYNVATFVSQADSALGVRNDHSSTAKKPGYSSGKTQTGKTNSGVKRPSTSTPSSTASFQPPVKQKKGVPKDFSLADASKTGTLTEYAFFDKVRKALRHQEVYENFLRTIVLFNQEIVTKQELVTLVGFFLSKFPGLFKEFKDLLGVNEHGGGMESVPHAAVSKERISGELSMEIDFNTCKKYGASYRAVPPKYVTPKCSGRTALCKEVLNDNWVSFPTWSEDSSFVTSRKTQYEENIYKCEDERFELDYVIETNLSTIKSLEAVLKKMNRMAPEESAKFRLDNALGGTSDSINRNSIHRIYGDKANDIIEGLKKNPVVAVPLVLRRLKAKDEEWREAQKQFNKMWKEQNEKFYLKSLDHQCANFKQHDIKAIRGKSLLNQVETIYDERADSEEAPPQGPMLSFTYEDRSLIEDAGNLIIHHVKRQTGVDKEAKAKIKQLVKHFVPDLFFAPRGELSDDDGDLNDDMDMDDEDHSSNNRTSETSRRAMEKAEEEKKVNGEKVNGIKVEPDEASKDGEKEEDEKDNGDKKPPTDLNGESQNDHDRYTLFYCNSTWYIFLRLHQILCARLLKAFKLTQRLIAEEALTKKERKESVALALRLRSPLDVETDDYYSYFMDMVRAVLDGNMEASQYEDTLREMYGIQAYQLFTMDKVVQNMVRQAQHLVMDEMPLRLTKMFDEQRVKGGAGDRWATRHERATLEQSYLRQAEAVLVDESPFKFIVHSQTAVMEIDMLDPPPESNEGGVKEGSAWSHYVTQYAQASRHEEHLHRIGSSKPIYLVRNKRQNSQWLQFKTEQEKPIKEEKDDDDDDDDEDDDMEDEDEKDEPPVKARDFKPEHNSNEDQEDVKVKSEPEGDVDMADAEDKDKSEEEPEKALKINMDAEKPSEDKPSGAETPRGEGESGDENMEERASPKAGGQTPMGGDEDEDDFDKREGAESDGGLGDDEDEEKTQQTASKRKKTDKVAGSPDGLRQRVQSMDNTCIKFGKDMRAGFVRSTGMCMIIPGRAARTGACHKAVTVRKYSAMCAWTRGWMSRHVTEGQEQECRTWMLGKAPDTRSNSTYTTDVERLEKTPYREFTRYSVDWISPVSGRTSPASAN